MEIEKIKEKLIEDLRSEVKTYIKYTSWTDYIKEIAGWIERIEAATTKEDLKIVALEINMGDDEYWNDTIKED